jgi:hypothetical protein
MQTIFLDFETFYDKEYSLRKMTPVEYVLDQRFETIGCAVIEPNKPTYWVDGPDTQAFFDSLDPNDTCVVTHNALFDMCIVAWRYGFVPKLMIDTLGVSRACLGYRLKSVSLANVARHLGLGVKGDTVKNVIGMSLAAIKANGLYDDYVEYSKTDVELCKGIYDRLVRTGIFPMSEIAIMDAVLRCAIQPKFELCQTTLAEHLHEVQALKEQMMNQAAQLGATKQDLMSNEKFAELLRKVGCEPPVKTSLVTGKEAYAFAKTDPGFIELEEHPNPSVQCLVAARLGHKSTLEETRTERLLSIANLQWSDGQTRKMPIPLRFSGAHTHRLSGDWKLNLQNLPRSSKIRRALIAPPDHSVVAVDASQIEARIVAWLCGQQDLVEAFARGEDIYSSFASEIFGYSVNKKTHPTERFMGKTSILGLGFQVGANKFQNTIEVQSGLQLGTKIEMPFEEALRVVSLYRNKFSNIPAMWRKLQQEAIPVLAGNSEPFAIGPVKVEQGFVMLPNRLKLHYHNLHQEEGDSGVQWVYEYSGKPKKLYGGSLLENIVQALARIHTMDAMARIQKRIPLALQVHDELVYVVPTELVSLTKRLLLEEMAHPPAWAPDLPLAAEADAGPSYGEAK